MLEEKKVLLKEMKWDLKVWEAALYEALERDIHPRYNRDLLTELVELRERLVEAEADRAVEAGELTVLVTSMSNTLMNSGMDPI
jgi:hypothetical protein